MGASEGVKVASIESDCENLLTNMNERLLKAKCDFEEWDNSEDMELIDQMETAIEYMNDMLEIIKSYKS
ncbi:hypothetical protein PQ478_08960 [Alkalihalophilus pseudofirmus]|uniref:hypothetical protein n=1 Tax=Alkalihalophilus pseudofirmus TaxID=79885 RepID=UPI00259B6EE8|nr:hypothetical protein [Alkalihalophilus pseudofirmus]WEG18600.1 hypothetical protein PQ478_08960 [Alkalihalophilus pseudofirmus]